MSMTLATAKPPRFRRSIALGEMPLDLACKADLCAKVLTEARKFSAAGEFDALSNQLLIRAGELLDDMDEILVALDPLMNERSFAVAASLHRELESIQSIIASWRRSRAAPRKPPTGAGG